MPDAPKLNFTHHPALDAFNVSKHAFLLAHPHLACDAVATSALVLDSGPAGSRQQQQQQQQPARILLVQRAATDSLPGLWEPPGGACDDADPTLLHAVARELWEESRLLAAHVSALLGPVHTFTSASGVKVAKLDFAVRLMVDDNSSRSGNSSSSSSRSQGQLVVRLDPLEHQSHVWATEDEVRANQTEHHVQLNFTNDQVRNHVLLAFEHGKSNAG